MSENKNENLTEIKETTGSDIEIYDEYDSTEVAENVKGKKKFRLKKRYVALGAVALLALGLFGRGLLAGQNQVTYVETVPVALGDIENVLSVSGTVESAETKTYFSDVTAPIAAINIKVGDKVASGDVLYTYDEDSLDLAQKNAELAIKQAKGSYSTTAAGASVSSSAQEYANTMTLAQINDRIDQITNESEAIQKQIDEKKNRINQTIDELNKVQMDYNQNRVSDGAEGYDHYERKDDDGEEMYLQTQEAIVDATAALTRDPQIIAWQDQLTALKDEASRLTEARGLKVNGGSVSASKASLESTELTQEDTISKIEASREGIKADFNGVVTAVSVVEGATVTAGTQTVTIANLDDVQVSVQISKSDLPKISLGQKVDITINEKPYEGEVTKISGTATKNSNGVAVVDTVITVTNPDSDIILGVEASNKIHAEKAENTIVLPYEYVLTDAEGDYVYVVEDGMAVRKNVTIGISSSTEAQITDGISAGDMVITSDTTNIIDGMPVAVMP